MPGLQKQLIEFPFARGLNQKAAGQLIQAPELVRLVDAEFDELGALRLRKPFGETMTDTGLSSETVPVLANCRRIYPCGNELVLFTKDTLYTWDAQVERWVSKGTHLAVKVAEESKFVTTSDQVQCDRAELNNTVVHVWTELAGSNEFGIVYYAITDKTTGAVIQAPTAISGGITRPRVIATATRILIFSVTVTPALQVLSIDPAALVGGGSSATVLGSSFGSYYDVVKVAGSDTAIFVAKRNPNTSYEVGIITATTLAVTKLTKARTCTDAIAVSSAPDGTFQVIRGNGTDVQGDKLSAALADVITDQAIGTVVGGAPGASFIAAAHRSTQDSGAYRCYVFWSGGETDSSVVFQSRYNSVDTAGAIGTEATLVKRITIGSRAFEYDGHVYVCGFFAGFSEVNDTDVEHIGQLQNTYFLFRDDATMHAKIATSRAGGFQGIGGWLPGVALTSGTTTYSWCATERRRIAVGDSDGYAYAERAPRDVALTFDSNEARRVARLGQTLYVTGGEILQYDGEKIVELGFHVLLWYYGLAELGSGGIVTNGNYAVKPTYRSTNAKGERDRSASGVVGEITIASQPAGITIGDPVPLHVTHKTSVAVEFWRTKVNPIDEDPFFLVTDPNPNQTTNPNRFLANDTTADDLSDVEDEYSDEEIAVLESNPENDGFLEVVAPPPATIILASDTRLFLAGIANEPDLVIYSKQRNAGEVAGFNEALSFTVPPEGGAITGLAFMGETLIVFRETAVYAMPGFGLDNALGGTNFGPPRALALDVGAVSAEAIATTPAGLVFKSLKGWYLLPRGGLPTYIGDKVCDYDSETVHAVHVVETQHQVRILTSGRILIFDYTEDAAIKWGEWSVGDGLHACIWNGSYVYLTSTGPRIQETSAAGADYALDVEVLVRLNGIQGFARCYGIYALGEYRSTHTLRFRVGEYAEDTYWDDETWTPSPTTVGGELEVVHHPSRQQTKALRVRLTSSATAGEKLKLSALAFEVGLKPGAFPHLPAAQRQ